MVRGKRERGIAWNRREGLLGIWEGDGGEGSGWVSEAEPGRGWRFSAYIINA